MNILLNHKHFEQDHLDAVVSEMIKLGAPTIRVYLSGIQGAEYVAIEGNHRLRAALKLNLIPELEIISADTRIEDVEGLDWEGMGDTVSCIGADWDDSECILTFEE